MVQYDGQRGQSNRVRKRILERDRGFRWRHTQGRIRDDKEWHGEDAHTQLRTLELIMILICRKYWKVSRAYFNFLNFFCGFTFKLVYYLEVIF